MRWRDHCRQSSWGVDRNSNRVEYRNEISIHVYVTDKRGAARVVYIARKNPQHCGVELEEPRNIWGVPFRLTNDWKGTAALGTEH
jgi:hypothetical protein